MKLFTFFLLSFVYSIANANESSAQLLFDHWQNKKPIPLISKSETIDKLNNESAYKTQFLYVRKRLQNDTISGFKAGLTSTAGQKKFNVDGPLAGILFSLGRLSEDRPIHLNDYQKLMLETEIGFRLKSNVSKPIENIHELKNHIASVFPAIELPDLGFEDMSSLTGLDIIAANVAASSYIVGPEKNVSDVSDLNTLTVSLTHNGKTINSGKGSDASGDQWQALMWLINKMIAEGYQPAKGQILITGALGKMLPAQKGDYRADFGILGHIQFKIQ